MINKSIKDAVQPRQTVEPNLVDSARFACRSTRSDSLPPFVLIGPTFKFAQGFQVRRTLLRRENISENQKAVEVKKKAFFDTNPRILRF